MKKGLLILLIVGLACNIPLTAQFYTTGSPLPNIKWNTIKTEYVQIIFDENIESHAQLLANQLNIVIPFLSKKAGIEPRKISVILHNYTTQANGFVSLAPKRMELYITPPADNLSVDWYEHLAIHESQHVVQLETVNTGVTKILRLLFGDGSNALAAAYLPFWFLEGQAVSSETEFSPTGRGKEGFFLQESKALVQNRIPTLEEAYFRSYKEFIPNHYTMGYEMVNYVNNYYNDSVWNSVVSLVGKKPFSIVPFYWGLKKYTGLSKNALSDSTWYQLKKNWDSFDEKHLLREYAAINKNRKGNEILNYTYPTILDDGKILVQKSSYDDITRLVLMDESGNEEKLHTPGILNNVSISSGGNYVVWTEYMPDPEYIKKDYSNIMLYNRVTDETVQLTYKGKFFSPAINKSGDKIVALSYDEFGNKYISVLDVPTGNIIDKIEVMDNGVPQYPVWNAEGNKLYITALINNKKYLVEHSFNNNKQSLLYNFENYNISGLTYWNNHIVFTADFDSLNQIYAFNSEDKTCYQLTYAKSGAAYPSVSASTNQLYFSNYTYKGYDISTINLNSVEWKAITPKVSKNNNFSLSDSIKHHSKVYSVEKYHQWKHLFNIHTWTPFYFDYSEPTSVAQTLSPGLQIFSQNLLETLISTASVRYNGTDVIFETGFLYKGIKPNISYNISYGETSLSDNLPLAHNLRLSYPVYLTKNKFYRRLEPSVTLNYKEQFFITGETSYISLNTVLDFDLYFYNFLKQAKRDIYPRWGQSVYVNHRMAPYNNSFNGSITNIYSQFYLPGLFKNDGVSVRGTFKYQGEANYFMPYGFSTIRGYGSAILKQLLIGSANYTFPILYPDVNIWRLLYLKRIRTNLFFDYAQAKVPDVDVNGNLVFNNQVLKSTGFELLGDIHLLHFFFPITSGIQVTYPFSGNEVLIGPVFRMELGFPE